MCFVRLLDKAEGLLSNPPALAGQPGPGRIEGRVEPVDARVAAEPLDLAGGEAASVLSVGVLFLYALACFWLANRAFSQLTR